MFHKLLTGCLPSVCAREKDVFTHSTNAAKHNTIHQHRDLEVRRPTLWTEPFGRWQRDSDRRMRARRYRAQPPPVTSHPVQTTQEQDVLSLLIQLASIHHFIDL